MSPRYDDHLDFRGGEFTGPVVGKVEYHQDQPSPTALDSLPARTSGFTGRDDELTGLLDALNPTRPGPRAVLVAAVSGLGGVGKTALAVEAAHEARNRGWFPGGTLFIDLHGYDDTPVTADLALHSLLLALGTQPKHIPVRAEERAAFYRTALARLARDKGPALVVADNASSVAQVRPLLPGDPAHRFLTTSRHKFPTLGARLLALDELTTDSARDLLRFALHTADPDDARLTCDSASASALATLCGCLPLALQIAAALLIADQHMPIGEFVRALSASRNRLDQLDDGDRSMRATFELSYRTLPEPQARLLRMLALAPGPETGIEALTALVGGDGLPLGDLTALERAHLIERGSSRHRWRMHDLVREYAVEAAERSITLMEEAAAARKRVLDHYLERTVAAVEQLRWWPGTPMPRRFESRAQAIEWLDTERPNLLATIQWAIEAGHATNVVQLGYMLGRYLYFRRYFDEFVVISRYTQDAAQRVGDREAEARAWNDLGLALRSADHADEAITALTRARELSKAVGDRNGEAYAWNYLGSALRVADRLQESLDVLGEACTLFRIMHDSNGEAYVWNNMGLTLMNLGRPKEAIKAHERARDLFHTVGNRDREARAWQNAGYALWSAGRATEAIHAYQKALEAHVEFEDWHSVGETQQHLAEAYETVGLHAEARTCWLHSADAYLRAGAEREALDSRERATTSLPNSEVTRSSSPVDDTDPARGAPPPVDI
ncbi:tetratricopeptide repeat protein [Streptomyces sp. NBC_00140]|uniref:tetratricopeptide repeat protein n=1 Tax=Streptomyces sp. NBC_00140 TaxID=2975664 RepID=UPI002250B4DA|nr:tetratricopeptide repeat protein [Streptomyces sp. NBC_00140]MCX5329164.1 tetratricopeptide repeat protein [Streptomyces sp. NBC_00140]